METTEDMLERNKAIYSSKIVKEDIKETHALEVEERMVRMVMRKELHMGYRLAKTVPVQSNSERCLVLRQQYALTILPMLEKRRRVINVDESWLNNTRFLRRLWAPSNAACTLTDKQVTPRISLIAAIDTTGKIWCALTQTNTDSDVMTCFLRRLS